MAVVGANAADVIEARRAGLGVRDGVLVPAPGVCGVVALLRMPMPGTVVDQVMATETGGLAIDPCRVQTGTVTGGRWPSNLLLLHSRRCDCDSFRVAVGAGRNPAWVCGEGCPVAALNQQGVERGVHSAGASAHTTANGNREFDATSYAHHGRSFRVGDTGGASRFYPQFTSEEALLDWLTRLLGGDVLRIEG